jgi:hypothetical protein
MTSELPDDPKRPRPDEDDAVDDEAVDEGTDDDEAERLQREQEERAFKDELENEDEFEPTLEVPIAVPTKRSRKSGRVGR